MDGLEAAIKARFALSCSLGLRCASLQTHAQDYVSGGCMSLHRCLTWPISGHGPGGLVRLEGSRM